MLFKESKVDFINKVINYGIGVNLSGFCIEEFSKELSNHFNNFTYYKSNYKSYGLVSIMNENGKKCELEIGNLGILFVNYDKDMAVELMPSIIKFITRKTFN